METASKIFAYIGIAVSFAFSIVSIVLAILGFIGTFKYFPPFFGADSLVVFDIILLAFGLFSIGVGILSLYQYFLVDQSKYDQIVTIFFIVVGIFALNIPFVLSSIFVLPRVNRYVS